MGPPPVPPVPPVRALSPLHAGSAERTVTRTALLSAARRGAVGA